MSFAEFELKVRKYFKFLIPAGQRYVWQDPNSRGGMRYCASTTNGWFITGNPASKMIAVYKNQRDREPTVVYM